MGGNALSANIPIRLAFVTKPDETGLGRVIVDGRYYGLPLAAVLDYKRLYDQEQAASANAALAAFPVVPNNRAPGRSWLIRFADGSFNYGNGFSVSRDEATHYPSLTTAVTKAESLMDVAGVDEVLRPGEECATVMKSVQQPGDVQPVELLA